MTVMKDLQYYLRLEYAFRVEPDPEGGFLASIPDLPGCYFSGRNRLEAVEGLEESKVAWLESYHAIHGEAPEPMESKRVSGRILLRLPRYLHKRLQDVAREEGVSINQYLVAVLAVGVSHSEVVRALRRALEPLAAKIEAQSSKESGTVVTAPEVRKPRKIVTAGAHKRRGSQHSRIGEELQAPKQPRKRR